ncbi:MAG: hypothetical protein ACREYE_23180 [Gammaproteobacteria bacterium]
MPKPIVGRYCHSEFVKKPTALGISRSGGARNPHVFQYTAVPALRRNATFLRSRRFFHKLSRVLFRWRDYATKSHRATAAMGRLIHEHVSRSPILHASATAPLISAASMARYSPRCHRLTGEAAAPFNPWPQHLAPPFATNALRFVAFVGPPTLESP